MVEVRGASLFVLLRLAAEEVVYQGRVPDSLLLKALLSKVGWPVTDWRSAVGALERAPGLETLGDGRGPAHGRSGTPALRRRSGTPSWWAPPSSRCRSCWR